MFYRIFDTLSHLESKKWLDKTIDHSNIICRVDSLATLAAFCLHGWDWLYFPNTTRMLILSKS